MSVRKLGQTGQNGKQDLVKRTKFNIGLELNALRPKNYCVGCGCQLGCGITKSRLPRAGTAEYQEGSAVICSPAQEGTDNRSVSPAPSQCQRPSALENRGLLGVPCMPFVGRCEPGWNSWPETASRQAGVTPSRKERVGMIISCPWPRA